MKTLRLIYMAVAAIFLVASCDDDSMNTDKAKVSDVFGNGQVKVVVTDTSYNLSWEPYTIYAGGRLAICTQYDVFVTPVYFDDTREYYGNPDQWHPVTTVDSCCARVSKNSVDAIFDDNSYFAFCVFPSGIGLNYASYNNFILSQTLNSSGRESVLIGASADPTMGHVEVSGEGEENMRKIGETVELTAIAYEGYKFVQWRDGSTDNPRKLLVTEEVYLEALFEETVHLYRVYVYAVDEYENSFDARQLLSINKNYVPLDDDDIVYQVAGAYEYGQTAIITVSDDDVYKFKQWSDGSTENPREFDVYDEYVYLTAIFKKDKYEIRNAYSRNNIWFLSGNNAPTGQVKDFSNFTINVGGIVGEDENGNAAVWDDNFEVVFHELENQEVDKDFQLKFSIKWEGDAETAGFRICSGADKYILEDVDKDWDAWDANQNTELIFDDFSSKMGQTFSVGRGDETKVEWGGKIGKRGKDYIGIEINLSGTEKDGVIYENGPGTFTISNMQVFMGGKKVWPKSE